MIIIPLLDMFCMVGASALLFDVIARAAHKSPTLFAYRPVRRLTAIPLYAPPAAACWLLFAGIARTDTLYRVHAPRPPTPVRHRD